MFLKSSTPPREHGNVARLLTSLPAANLDLDRGRGHHTDLVVFDPAKFQGHAAFETQLLRGE